MVERHQVHFEEIVRHFADVIKRRHEYARDWKKQNQGKVFGYMCTYVPEEIIYAAGILPVRILGSHEPQDVTEPFISGMYCPFCRDCLAQALKGRYDYLDGLVKALSCAHMRNAFLAWQAEVAPPYTYFISTPENVQSRHARDYLRAELASFKESLEEWTKQSISENALRRAIAVYNTNRHLLRQMYELRKADRPLISGSEVMEVTLSSQLMDKEEHNEWLRQLLSNMVGRADSLEPGVRLMLVGSEDDDVDLCKLIESLGGAVVIDDHCTGSRYFWNEVVLESDVLVALANRYIDKPTCAARDFPERRRQEHLIHLAQDYRVQGVIFVLQKFCHPHQFDTPGLQQTFKERLGIPSLVLEYDLAVPLGQFRTRIEAFLETFQLG